MSFKLKKLIFGLFFIINIIPAAAKSKKDNNEVFYKYVHPRIYEFDLCDAETQVFLGLNKWSGKFSGTIDYTKYVKSDMPQAGDKVIFYFKGYSKKNAGQIFADILDENETVTDTPGKQFVSSVVGGEEFEGKVSFILNKDVQKSFVLYLYSSMPDKKGQIDQCYLHFTRVVDTTDTVKEIASEKKAVRNNVEIVEVVTDIKSDEEIEQENAAELAAKQAEELVAKQAEELVAQEAAKKLEEENARLEAERLELEKIKQKEELQKAIDSVVKISRYEKEYLNDYMVYDEPELSVEETTKEILIENPDETDDFGRTLLMKAAKAGNDWRIKNLLKSGANVNLKDKDGWTALMYAVRYQESMVCVDLLIEAGALIKVYNKYNSTPLSLAACYNNNPEILKKLLSYYTISDKEAIKSLILLLSEKQTSEFVQIAKLNVFMDLSIPLNTFYEGKTPLMYACEFGNSTLVIGKLLDNNAVTTIRSSEGKTAYDYATENKNLKHDDIYWALNKK